MRRLFLSKPDGFLIRLRCYWRGHRWWLCEPYCCGPTNEWCGECLTFRVPTPITGRDQRATWKVGCP